MAFQYVTSGKDDSPPHRGSPRHRRQPSEPFKAIWDHYQAAHFIYAAKLERLTASLGLIQTGWPHLLDAPPDLFHFHAARHEAQIVSSICAYRDTEQTFVIQHAASSGNPEGMLACIRDCLTTNHANPDIRCNRMYFRPENRWPARAARAIANALGPKRSTFEVNEYLYCDPMAIAPTLLSSRDSSAPRVRELEPADCSRVVTLARKAVGVLRARALGLLAGAGWHDLLLHPLHERFLKQGLRRARRILVVETGGQPAGFALCHSTNFPMNFSFLCSRTEILIHPDAPDRPRLVSALARASILEAAVRGDPAAVILTTAEDAPAAMAGGYQSTGKRYACLLWSREATSGTPASIRAIEQLYQPVTTRRHETGRLVLV